MPVFTFRPIRTVYLFACLGVGLLIAHYGNASVAVLVTFLLVQFDITVRS